MGPSGATAGGALTSTAAARAAADVRRQDGRHGPVQQELTGFACDAAHGPLLGTRRERSERAHEQPGRWWSEDNKQKLHRRGWWLFAGRWYVVDVYQVPGHGHGIVRSLLLLLLLLFNLLL